MKKWLEGLSVNVHLGCYFVSMCFLVIILKIGVEYQYGKLAIFLTIFWFFMTSLNTYYAFKKTVDQYWPRFYKRCFDEIKTFLTEEYQLLYLFHESTLDPSYRYYAKLDTKKNCVVIYRENKEGNGTIYHTKEEDYIGFLKNFYIP